MKQNVNPAYPANPTRKNGSRLAHEMREILPASFPAASRPLVVYKFGGTSVGDARCIAKVVEIIKGAARESDLVVVVSAMSGVTNQLVDAASQSEAGSSKAVAEIFEQLRVRHHATLNILIQSPDARNVTSQKMEELFEQTIRLCQGTSLLRELTSRVHDAISALGERLSILLVAAALNEQGIPAEPIEATELIATDSCHGSAEPRPDLTRQYCNARLRTLLHQGVVPVVTGFIGATVDKVLTTLGRGGSDYSAAILGAALDANEVIIWTDVDGLQTADPRLVPGASTIREVSYREAAELAYFGAKVLHPKTLCPLVERKIPLRIRNTFAPGKAGTRITATRPENGHAVTALTTLSDAALITITGPGLTDASDALGRTTAIVRRLRADLFLLSQSSAQNEICLVVRYGMAARTVEQLRREFAAELGDSGLQRITLDPSVAVLTIVGEKLRNIPGIMRSTFAALGRESIDALAISHGASQSNISIVLARKDMQAALVAVHQEFGLAASQPDQPSIEEFALKTSAGGYTRQPYAADAD